MNVRVSNSYLKSSRAYHACQMKLLKEEISIKKSRIRTLEKDFKNRKEKLRKTLGTVDYTHVICLFLTQNDRKLAHHQNIYSKKLFNLGLEVSKVSHDPDKIIFIYSSHKLSKSEKSLLCKGLNFAMPPYKLEYSDYLLPFELLYQDIKGLDLPNEKTNFLKAKIQDCALSSFKLYNEKGTVSSLNKDEISALKTLSKNNDLIIQKSDKGNSIVLINKSDYIDQMYNILSDSKKFGKSSVVGEKHLNSIIGIEKKLTNLLKELKALETISENDYKKLKPRGSSFGVLYGLCKSYKKVLDKCPPFRPIFSAIKTPSHNVAKFLVPLIETITKNNFAVKNKEICDQNSVYFMTNLDVESLFANIPLEETIKICCDSLYKNQELVSNINKNQFEKLLRAALCNNYFLFDGIVYQQVDGVSMGSP